MNNWKKKFADRRHLTEGGRAYYSLTKDELYEIAGLRPSRLRIAILIAIPFIAFGSARMLSWWLT